ncbi:TetR/AcrR family transcriptional regulator [Mycolicibacterium sp. P1-18]|uniref:TetR/AcrR family transcriptional regulator n=1 Tax=Mycolicibacterium sp. P1-18 TaxID=2024615 RepID=UPI0011F18EB1|nr:TetR/AcrR family transcriptional regulator [Mycolicibacterium sp. P1-18]KAA0095252.1 TetR/AcrR family transcriptional regulator [Mycolicibacterium sp. P1-18]
MAGDWLADRRADAAADRILDAADALFTRLGAARVGMNDVAAAAGCSRATLYRYFENRDALYTAYTHREAHRVFRELGDRIAVIADPRERLLEGVLAALSSVRESPSLSAWFIPDERPVGGEMAQRSLVIETLTASFLQSLGVGDVEPRARWLVRVIISLLTFPGSDSAEERNMLDQFVLPVVADAGRRVR